MITTTRRRFLKSAAAAIAAPGFLSLSTWGQSVDSKASERIRLGMIGVGNMGGGHLHAFLGRTDVQIVAICDVDSQKREAARRRAEEQYAARQGKGSYRGVATTNEFEEVLARDDIDAVVIAAPDHWHALIAIAACEAGKDVYCEKPLSLTVREARAMVRAARGAGTVFQTGSQQRSSENFRYASELVRSGHIGELVRVHVGVEGPSGPREFAAEPIPDGFDWNRWLGPAPWAPYNSERRSGNYSGGWRFVRDYSGGMMTDWGAHHFDIAQWGLGMDESGPIEIVPPETVRVSGARGKPLPQQMKSWSGLTYRYANGVTVHHGDANGVLFVGTEGKVEVNRGYLRTWPETIGQIPIGPNDVHLYESPGHREDWIRCIRNRRRPICDVEVGCRSVTVCHLGNIAYWVGRPLRWDPQREELLDDEAARRWLDRPKRAPWRLHGAGSLG